MLPRAAADVGTIELIAELPRPDLLVVGPLVETESDEILKIGDTWVLGRIVRLPDGETMLVPAMLDGALAEAETWLAAIVEKPEEPSFEKCEAEIAAVVEVSTTFERRELLTVALKSKAELTVSPVALATVDERKALTVLSDGDNRAAVVFTVVKASIDVAKLPGKLVDDSSVLVTVVFNSSGLRVAVCWTREAQAVAATAPTNTDVHDGAGAEGNPAHKAPFAQE